MAQTDSMAASAGTVATLRSLVVVVPAYNEAATIGAVLVALRSAGERLRELGVRFVVYVVDDGSSDDTARLAADRGADQVIRHRHNLGLGAAVRSGLRRARRDGADMVVKFDADGQHDAADLSALLQPILTDEADIVYGDRHEKISYRMPWLRRWGNRAFNYLMRWLTGWPIRDGQPGIFAINKDYLQQFNLPGDYNYSQQLLLDAYQRGMRFAQVPVAFNPRRTGSSFISLAYPFKVLPQLFWVLVSVRPMKVFAPIGLVFLLVGVVIAVWELGTFFAGASAKPIIHVNAVLGTVLFGLQTLFFGTLAELIVRRQRR